MEGKLMNHIEFKFIRNAYPLHEKLFCYFQSPNGSQWQPEVGDWVGLYKVGWNSLKEHRVRKHIQNEWLETRRNTNVDYVHVVFEQHELPKDFEGLYQFVYVTKCDVVKGISPAFRFERVLPVPQQQQNELRRMVESIEKIGQEINGQLPRSLEREPMGKIESDLIKECQRLNLNWGKITEETVNGKLMQKYLNNLRLIQKDEEVTKKIEELFVENGRLCTSLKTRIQEVQDLKKDCDDMKSINGDLLGKLALAERKVEQLEREKNLNMRKIEELAIKEQLPRVFGQLQGKHILHDLEETTKWLLQDDCEKVQPELKRGNSFYGELETPIDARVKLVQRVVEEPIQQQQQQQQQQTQKAIHTIEKIFREVDGTPSQVRLLKRVIEELKNDNEVLRERVRQIDGERQPEIQLPVKTMTSTLIKDITGLCQLPTELVVLHGEKQYQSLPTIGEQQQQQQQQQSILSTITVPEQTGKSSITITTGRISGVEEQKQQQQQQQRELRGQVGEYLNRLDEQIRNKIEERLRNKLQEQLQGKVEVLSFVEPQQQQQQQKQELRQQFLQQAQDIQRQQLYKVDEMIRQKIEQQKPRQPWSMQVNEELLPSQKWRLQQQLEEQTRKLRDELTIGENTPIQTTTTTITVTKMCPVCGIVMPNELNVCDFEIHVNSHFTD